MKALKYLSCILLLVFQPISAQNFWQQTNGPYGIPTVYDFLQYNDSTIFLGTDEGVIRSQDNGETWSRITGQYLNSNILCIAKDYFGDLYIGTRGIYPSGLRVLLKSTDQGNTWNYVITNHDAEIRFIFIPHKDTILIGSWNMGVIRTFDGGMTWSRVNNGNIYNGIYEIIQLDDGSVLAGSAGGGVFKTTNWGDSWIATNAGIEPNPSGYWFASSFLEESPGNIYTGTSRGIYYSTNYGNSWTKKSTGINDYRKPFSIIKDSTNNLYTGLDMGDGVYYSTNGGDYWHHLGLSITTYALAWDSDSRLYAGGSNGLFRHNFEDSTWIQVYNQGYNPVEVDDLCLTRSNYILAVTHWDGFQWSSNNGESWNRTNFAGTNPYAMETINDSIFIAGKNHIYVSNDFGNTWFIPADFGILGNHSILYDSTSQTLYAGSESFANGICGIYYSNDFGQNWDLLSTFPNTATRKWVNAL